MRIAVLLAFALSLALPLTAHAQGSGTEAASAKHLLGIINDILDMSRIESGSIPRATMTRS